MCVRLTLGAQDKDLLINLYRLFAERREKLETINVRKEEILVINKFLLFLLKYVGSPIICVFLLLLEAPPLKRIEFKHYERLPLWEGNVIIFPNHRSWWDVVVTPHLYFPWWFRELKEDLVDLLKETISAVHRILHWIIDERIRIKIGNGQSVFSKDVPITAADKHNLRAFPWLEGIIFRVNREKNGGTPSERAVSARYAQRVLKKNGRVVIFAEGGMLGSVGDEEKIFDVATKEPILRLIEPGFCRLVSMTGSKVIIVIERGTDKVLPRGSYFPRLWRKVTISIGEPLVFPIGTDPELIRNTIDKARLDLYYSD